MTAQLPKNHTQIYHSSSVFSSANNTEADKYWDALNTQPIAVALSDEYARVNGLTPAARFPWDDGMGLYYIKGFHDLHCLVRATSNSYFRDVHANKPTKKLVRRSISEYRSSSPQTVPGEHISHCLDALRQTVMCAADDLPMASLPDRPDDTGDGAQMCCRSWDLLESWASAPERDACFEVIDEYRPLKSGIERFAFCKQGSRYWDAMSLYFQKWGHSENPWVD